MPNYSNGHIPDGLLVTFNTGWNSTDGNWKHQLSASTYRKHLALLALTRQNTGRTLTITEGWGAYRPYNIQVLARQLYGYGAATPGHSSHGGFWEGQQTLAIDYGNWGWVYGWNRDDFFWAVREVGLTPGLIHPSRGNNYPDEPWHVVDLDPWAPVPAGLNYKEDDMFTEEDRERLNATYAALFGARNITGDKTPISWVNTYGDAQSSDYGVLPIVIHNQTLIAKQAARITELESLLNAKPN